MTRQVYQTSFKYPFAFLVNTFSEKIYENYKKQQNLIKTIETRNPSEHYLSEYYYWFIFSFSFNYINTLFIINILK